MNDAEGVKFLQWCLPRLRLRWKGFRKVRSQVLKRIKKRMQELGLATLKDYRAYLERHDAEWALLDSFSWIPISRFYRDKRVYEFLQQEVLGDLAETLIARGETELRCWSLGCAGGEEPFSLAIIWKCALAKKFPPITLRVLATDINPDAIRRAQAGYYVKSSVKDLPEEFITAAFDLSGEGYCLKPEFREPVSFLVQDIRQAMPAGSFHLIVCRYLICTYFEEHLQREILRRIEQKLNPYGALVIGAVESLPEDSSILELWSAKCGVYRKTKLHQ